MPGLSIAVSLNNGLPKDRLLRSISSLLHDRSYTSQEFLASDGLFVGVARYPEYPVSVMKLDGITVIAEGRIYGSSVDSLRRDIGELLPVVMQDAIPERSALAQWISSHDGDYVVAFVDGTRGRACVVNDSLGRLPIYVSADADTSLISREIGFVLGNLAAPDFDRMSLAEYLLFGFCLRDRTLFRAVRRMSPASLLRVGFPGEPLREIKLWDYNLEEKAEALEDEDAADLMAAAFIDSCRIMAAKAGSNVVSLSGGLDSRSVVAGLKKAGEEFESVTFRTSGGANNRDVTVAEMIARSLAVRWRSFNLSPYTGESADLVLRQKCGLISIGMAFDVPFMQELQKIYGSSAIHFSGDGGDKLLPTLVPSRHFSSIRDLAKYVAERNAVMPMAIVSNICQISPNDLLDSIGAVLAEYPERSPNQKYARFLMQERAMKWLFEGEDRNRCSFWSCSPFYSRALFQHSIACPDKVKAGHRLFRRFLTSLSPEAAAVVDANRGSAITSPIYPLKLRVVSALAHNAKMLSTVKNILRPPAPIDLNSILVKCLRTQMERQSPYGEYLDLAALKALVSDGSRCSHEALENVMTITIMAERLHESENSLNPLWGEPIV